MRSVCVFCGSSPGTNSCYMNAAQELGRIIAEEKLTLVYGGGNTGLMGEISNTVMKQDGKVIGVIPKSLAEMEAANTHITKLHVVKTMHERKAMMANFADAFIAMPGGMGTLEEFTEVVTWAQLGFHKKACGLLNIENYYGRLIEFLDYAVNENFIKPQQRALVLIDRSPRELIKHLKEYKPPVSFDKRID